MARPLERLDLHPTWSEAMAAPGGYAWWYIDGVNSDGDGLACICLVGSIFSPSLALRVRRGEAVPPREHCAVNLALYRRFRKVAWVMSEYPGAAELGDDRFAAGGSRLHVDGTGLHVLLDERSAPFRRRIRGEIHVTPLTDPWPAHSIADGGSGRRHLWQGVAPKARLVASFRRPDFHFDGEGYHDRNWGDGRLEASFRRWGWGRFADPEGATVVYAFTDRAGTRRAIELTSRDHGPLAVVEEPAPDEGPQRLVGWGLRIPVTFAGGDPPRWQVEPGPLVERAPFYARYRARLHRPGQAPLDGVGEYIDFDRFNRPGTIYLSRWLMRPIFRRPIW